MGPAWPCGTGGPAGGRAGAARDAQTRGHYFCSEPRTALRPGPLIKPPRSRPPPSRPDAKHLCRPRPGPRPRPPRPSRQAWPRARPPTRSRAPGRGRPQPAPRRSEAHARARRSPSDPAQVTYLLGGLTSPPPHTHRALLTSPCDAAARCFVSSAPCPCSCSSKDPSRVGASPVRRSLSPCPCPQDS